MPTGHDLDRLHRDLLTAPKRLMGASARASRSELARSIDDGFANHADIHGRPYPTPKSGGVPMERTGTLRRDIKVVILPGADAYRVKALETTPYGVILRDGTDHMAPRQFIPRPDEPLPTSWDARQRAALERAVKMEQAE